MYYRSEPIVFRKAVPPKPDFRNTARPCILKPEVAARRRATRHHICSSSALHERVWYLPFPSVVVLRAFFRALLAAVGRCRWSGRARGRAHDWAAAALRLLTAALVTTVRARTAWRHRCSGASRRALARGWTLKSQPSFREDLLLPSFPAYTRARIMRTPARALCLSQRRRRGRGRG